MATPTLAVRIAVGDQPGAFTLDSSTLDSADVLGDGLTLDWDDVSEYVRRQSGVTINRGGTNKRGPYFTAEAGTCTFTLDNSSGIFDPFVTNAGSGGSTYGTGTYGSGTYGGATLTSPYFIAGESILRPGLPVSIQATFNSVTYNLFTGRVRSWLVNYPEAGIDSTVVVTANDAVADLAQSLPSPSATELGAGESPSQRIDRALDAIDWPAERRDLTTTDATRILSTFLDDAAWSELQSVSDAVNGYLWVDPGGTVKFEPRSGFPRSADFAVGTATDAVPTRNVEISNDIDQLFNVVKLSRTDGNDQTVTDVDSITTYGGRYSFERRDLPLETDEAVGDSLTYILSQYKDLRLRCEGFAIELHNGSSDTSWARMLDLDVLRRVQASFTTPYDLTITRDGLVRGLRLRIDGTTWRWDVSTTAAPEALGDFILDTSVLDTGTLAAF